MPQYGFDISVLQICMANINQYQNQGKVRDKMDVLTLKQINKQNSNCILTKQLQRLKIQLNDKVFEINKLEEDYAEEKAKQFIDFQRERQALNRTVKELKEKLQFENQEWGKKVEELRQMSVQDKLQMKSQCQQQIKIAQIEIKQACLKTFQQEILSLKKEISDNQAKSKSLLASLSLQKETAIQAIIKSKDSIIVIKEQQFKATLQNLKIENQKAIKILHNIYVSEKNAKEAVESQLNMYLQQYVKEKIGLQHKIEQLKKDNSQLKDEINKLNTKIHQLTANAISTKRLHEESIKELNISKIKDLQRTVDDFNKQIEAQKRYFDGQVSKIKAQTIQMQTIYQQKQKRWEQRGQMMLKTIHNNEKKPDNVKIIKKLEFQLMKKQNMLERQRQSLKKCQLELQNMEDIYDKMFVSNNYLYKFRAKSFKMKKLRVPNQLNQSNSSIFIQQRVYTEGDKQN